MNIEYSPIVLSSAEEGNSIYEAEGDCACPTWTPTDMRRTLPGEDRLRQILLQRADATSTPLDDSFFVLANPSQQGGVTVLNTTAALILQQFALPQTADEVYARLVTVLPQAEVLATIEELWQSGILVESDVVAPTFPTQETLLVWLHVTNACNLRCTYCYVNKTNKQMTEETGYGAVDAALRSALTHGYKRLKLKYAGGEALLSFARILQIHDYAEKVCAASGLRLDGVILSNGVALNRRHLSAISERNLRLMISLDGLGAEHDALRPFVNGRGSVALVIRAIELALAEGVIPHISLTVTTQNVDSLPETLDWIIGHDLPFNINFYRENEASRERRALHQEEEKLIEGMRAAFQVIEKRMPRRSLLSSLVDRADLATLHQQPCGVGENYLVIDHLGQVAKCQMTLQQPITTISAPDPLGLIRIDEIGIQNVAVEEKEGCRTCKWRYWCAGGCPLATHQATGRYDVKSPNCNIYKALYPDVVRLEGLRLLRNYQAGLS